MPGEGNPGQEGTGAGGVADVGDGGSWPIQTGAMTIGMGGGGAGTYIPPPERIDGESDLDWRLRVVGAYIRQVPTTIPPNASGPPSTHPEWRPGASLNDLPVEAVWRVMNAARSYAAMQEELTRVEGLWGTTAELCKALWQSTPPGRSVRLTRRQWEMLADLYPDDPIPEDDD